MAYTEWTFQGRVLSWISELIEDEQLAFDGADQEVMIEGRKRPDIVVWKNRKLREVALLISLKAPQHDAWEVADEALSKAWRLGARFFATWNVNKLFLWDRYEEGDLYDQLSYHQEVTNIRSLREMDRVEASIKSFLRNFLREFSDVYYDVKPLPPLPIDERFIFRLRSAIDAFSIPAFYRIKEEWRRNDEFRGSLRRWFAEQAWTFTRTDEDFEKVARQYVYLLINKIVFYNILRMKVPGLSKIRVPLGVEGEQFREILQSFFNQALRINYETIFAADFLDTIPLSDEVTGQLRRFIDKVSEYDFSKVGYEVIGRVFERLIPERERHKLGQYFTRSDVVDLIVGFCVRSPEANVLDPACGAGTFLVRSYFRKNLLDSHKPHEELLNELYGIDIAKFPAHLTTINLAARDLSVEENYPRVLCEDFFDVIREKRISILKKEYVEKYRMEGLDLEKLMVKIPLCDAVVMNPPYTRQEEMESLVFPEGYRTTLQKLASEEWDGFYVGKRSSIYSYFFFHSGHFLKEKGRLGLITSNSWLDVDYGKYLQQFFLENFKIVAIIESKVERWFEDADINTAVTILQGCREEKERDSNLVKFVQLKKPLEAFIPPAQQSKNEEEKKRLENDRWDTVENFIKLVETTNEYYRDEEIKIFPKTQKELWEEGYDETDQSYVGSKWGKYLRAPDVFFKILEKGKGLFVPLKEVAEVKFGIKTGANKFFYLTEEDIKKRGIEKEFWMHKRNGKWVPNYLLKSPKEVKSVLVNPQNLKYRVLMIHEDKNNLEGKEVLRYITWGEEQGFHERPTCASRKRWYELPELPRADILFRQFFDVTFNFPLQTLDMPTDHTFYYLCLRGENRKLAKALAAMFNSTLYSFITELYGRTVMGQGVLIAYGPEMRPIPTIKLSELPKSTIRKLERNFVRLAKREIENVFEEIGAETPEEVSLDKAKSDRRELDKIVMGEILGLTDEEQLEVYKAVVDLVKSRIERAESVKKRKKKVKGMDVNSLVQDIFDEVGKGRLTKFPDDYVEVEGFEFKEISVPEGEAEVGQDLYGFYVKIDGKEIRCESPYEARYIQYAVLNGKTTVKIFKDERLIREAVREYGSLLRQVKERINEYLESTIPDRKLRKRIKDNVWKKLTGQK